MATNAQVGFMYQSTLYGMIQRQDMDKIPDANAVMLCNISLSKPGTWSKRKGSLLLGTTLAGSKVQALCSYDTYTGTRTLRKIVEGTLYTYNYSTNTWTSSIASGFSTEIQIYKTNFLNRMYYISPSDYLSYETGTGSLTVVGTGSDRVYGQGITTAQDTLFVLSGNKVYYSYFNPVANAPTHQLWNPEEGSLAASTRFVNLPTQGVGLYTYQGYCYAFTKTKMYRLDLARIANNVGPESWEFGLAGARAITQCNGYMIFMTPDGRIWAFGGTGQPQDVSWPIEDDENGDAVINNLDFNLLPYVAAGSNGSVFYFSVATTSFHGETFTNAVLVGHMPQSFNTILWSLYTYPNQIMDYCESTKNGKSILLFANYGNGDVYQVGIGANDGSTVISAYARTKFYDFGQTTMTKGVQQFLFKYRPQHTNAQTYLYVKYAQDGVYSYTTLTDPDAISPVTKYGVVQMYNGNASVLDDMDKLNIPSLNYRTLSLEIGNLQSDEGFEISAIGFGVKPGNVYSKRIKSV